MSLIMMEERTEFSVTIPSKVLRKFLADEFAGDELDRRLSKIIGIDKVMINEHAVLFRLKKEDDSNIKREVIIHRINHAIKPFLTETLT